MPIFYVIIQKIFTFYDAIGIHLDIDTDLHPNYLKDLFGLDLDTVDKIFYLQALD